MHRDIAGDRLTYFEKGMVLLARVIRDKGNSSLRDLASELDIPLSTAYRLISAQKRAGLLRAAGRGRFSAGRELLDLASGFDARLELAEAARPHLRRLARQLRRTVHLGVLENDMVTYLVKEQGGEAKIFTLEGMQLEAYCSAIGKTLLAALENDERERYLTAGPFVALTPQTITDSGELRKSLEAIQKFEYAVDHEEVSEGLRCIAIPLRDRCNHTVAAVSVSQTTCSGALIEDQVLLASLQECVGRIGKSL
jgi:IclR family transcriptional regulator, acetate operon repressor